jgi:iron complex outermembrane recepter protein
VYQDWDGTPLTLYHTDRPATWNQHSHELRLNTGDRLSYTAGVYYWESDYRIDLTSYIGFGDLLFGLPFGTVLFPGPQTVVQNTESTAFFIEGDYKLNDAWTLTLGGRYTKDEKDSGVVDPLMPELAVRGSLGNPFREKWSEFTPKASLATGQRRLMFYGLYSKGFRAGGFNGRPGTYEAASIPYDPETVDNFEARLEVRVARRTRAA